MESLKKAELENASYTLMFYFVVVILVTIFNTASQFKSGSCTPNLDVFSFFLVGLMSLVLLFVNVIRRIVRKRDTLYSSILHLVGFSTWCLILRFGG